MSRLTGPKFPTIAGVAGIGMTAAVIGLALWHAPSRAAESMPPHAASVPLLGLAKDELQDPALFQSKGGVLDMMMVAHEAQVSMFSPFRTNGWVYEVCQRPVDGTTQCPKGSFSSNEYGGSRLQIEPGDTLKVRMVNLLPIFTLPIDPDSTINPNAPMDENAGGRSLNPTSLHTHGLLVSPHYAVAKGAWGDNAFARVFNPANGLASDFDKTMGPVVYGQIDYEYRIPTTHPAGLFWFHPHPHGLVQAQLTSGMSGVLTIGHIADEFCIAQLCRDQLAQIPQRQLLLKDTQIESDGTLRLDQDTGFCAVDDSVGSTSPSHQGGCDGSKSSPVGGLDHTGGRWFYSINGQVYPSITVGMPAGQIWRITNSSANTTYDLNLWLPDERRQMLMQVISLDGVSVGTSGKGVTQPTTCISTFGPTIGICTTRLHLMPASRAEIWIGYRDASGYPRQQPTPIPAILRTSGFDTGPSGDNYPAIDLAKVNIATGAVPIAGDGAISARTTQTSKNPFPNAFTASTLPAATSCVPLAPGHARRIFLNAIDSKTAPFGMGYEELDQNDVPVPGTFIDVRSFDHMNPPLCLSLQPGNKPEVERWQLVNLADEDHSVHIHQVRFSVVSAPTVDGTITAPRFGIKSPLMDSLPLQHADGVCNSVDDWRRGACTAHVATIQIPFKIAGEFVFHCHVLEHEDGGMMAGIRVLNNP
jgi:FtsP/CotA-like multicopper oxidase with cupredoxin domain